jgi:hypothetical protein
VVSSNGLSVNFPPFFFPPENETTWQKGHGKLVSRRIKTLEVTPESIGLCGCWRIAAVERVSVNLSKPTDQQTPYKEIAYYLTSRSKQEMSDKELLDVIVGHWDAIENGTHYVRDVTFREDNCRIRHPKAARNMVTLRNFAIGLFNVLQLRDKTKATSLPSWQRSMTASQALKHLLK